MSIVDRAPGMRPGATKRNAVIAVIGIIAFFMLIPFLLVGAVLAIPVALGRNYRGWGDRVSGSMLGRLPGLSNNAGWKIAGASLVYLIIILGVVGAALPASPAGNNSSATNNTTISGVAILKDINT